MLTTILIVIVAALIVIILMASRQPDNFHVERSATIDAAAERIFPLLEDFRRWPEWSPWEKLDPAMKKDFGGPETGVGSWMSWDGNKKAGQGRMEIIESEPTSRLRLKLDFIKPFKSNNVTTFVLAPRNGTTDVRWLMDGPATFPTKVMTVFTSMDKLVGKDFEEGLANLKRQTEGRA